MFTLKKTEYISRSVRLRADLVEALEKLATQNGLSFTAVVAQCCEYALDHMEEEEQNKREQ